MVAAIVGSGLVVWKAVGESRTLVRSEQRAVRILRAVAGAQRARRDTGAESPATLADLVDGENAPDSLLRIMLETADRHDTIFSTEDYCFIVYLCDEEGRAVSKIGDRVIRPGFWIAYAWPRHYGPAGRRVFVLDSFGELRSWNNLNGADPVHQSVASAPPANRAPPTANRSYPFRDALPHDLDANRWIPE